MIVECDRCGAPLHVVPGQSIVTCDYCRSSTEVATLRTTSSHTPENWQPPAQWTPPAHLRATFSGPLPYQQRVTRTSQAPAPTKPSTSANVVVTLLVVVLTAVGGFVASVIRGASGSLFVTGINLAAPPTLGMLIVGSPPRNSTSLPGRTNGSYSANRLMATCRGYITPAPDLLLRVDQPVEASLTTASSSDLTMVIRDPSGGFRCDDDSGQSLNPRIVGHFAPGAYYVWIGSFSEHTASSYTLEVETYPPGTVMGSGGTGPTAIVPINPTAPSSYGVIENSDSSEPMVREGSIAGIVDASTLGTNCRGWVEPNPEFVLQTSVRWQVQLLARSRDDLTMVVRMDDGTYRCDDDSGGGHDPMLNLELPPGAHQVWLGTYSRIPRAAFTFTLTPAVESRPRRGAARYGK